MYERLPQELKVHAGFCGWKYEQREGRKTKVPKTVTWRNADTSNPSDFCSFEEILQKVGDFDRIGIAVKDDLAAIDINHSIVDGSLTDLAAGIVEKVRSYTEISPFGEGIHIIGKAHGFFLRSHMTEAQAKAYDEFIDYMVELYREFSYLTEDDEGHEAEESVG